MAGTEVPLPWAEAGWGRSRALPQVDDAFVQERIRRWPELLGRPWSVLGGGLRSLNLLVGDDLVLRIAPGAGPVLAKEAAVLRRLHGRVRVPRVLDGDGDALLLEYVPHVALPGTEEAGRAAGSALARIQRDRFPRAGFLDETLSVPAPFPSGFEGLRAWGLECLDGAAGGRLGARASRVRAAWDSEADRLVEACREAVLVHSDYKPANVKWLPDERDVLVLDWEFAWAGPPLLDAGMILRWGAPPGFVSGLASGYRSSGGDLPDDWRRTGELLDLFNLVGLLAMETSDPVRERDLLRRIEETLQV